MCTEKCVHRRLCYILSVSAGVFAGKVIMHKSVACNNFIYFSQSFSWCMQTLSIVRMHKPIAGANIIQFSVSIQDFKCLFIYNVNSQKVGAWCKIYIKFSHSLWICLLGLVDDLDPTVAERKKPSSPTTTFCNN